LYEYIRTVNKEEMILREEYFFIAVMEYFNGKLGTKTFITGRKEHLIV
jgi:hypothetical protein